MTTPSELLTTIQVAAMLGIKPNTLEINRVKGTNTIPFVKLGTSKQAPVRYRRADVETWLAERTYASTSAYSAQGN